MEWAWLHASEETNTQKVFGTPKRGHGRAARPAGPSPRQTVAGFGSLWEVAGRRPGDSSDTPCLAGGPQGSCHPYIRPNKAVFTHPGIPGDLCRWLGRGQGGGAPFF